MTPWLYSAAWPIAARRPPRTSSAAHPNHRPNRPPPARVRSPTGCGRGRWPSWSARSSCSARGAAGADAGAAAPRLAHPLGPARVRQDHAGPAAGQGGGRAVRWRSRRCMSGVADLRKSLRGGAGSRAARGRRPILFIDEIHRFNRAQQDGLLHEVEDGTVTPDRRHHREPVLRAERRRCCRAARCWCWSGSTSRRSKLLLHAGRGGARPRAAAWTPRPAARLAELADGDGRYLLNLVETLVDLPAEPAARRPGLADLLQRRLPLYDKSQEAHYNLISALHKSVRGSDPDAALYWLTRMLQGGEDPRYLARRLVRMAIEDIGLADPQALLLALRGHRHVRAAGLARGRAGAGADHRLSGAGAQVERGLSRLQGGPALGQGARLAAAAAPYPQRTHGPDEAARLRPGLRLRPRRAGPVLRPGLFPRRHGARQLLPPTDRGAEAAIGERMQRWAAIRAKKARR